MESSQRYKAAVVTAARQPIELWEYEVIPPPAGCINIAVCESDEPFIIGHDGLGRIMALGEGVTTDHSGAPVAVGDVVYLNPIRPCHACYECTIHRDLTGYQNGTFVSPTRNRITWASYTYVATLQPNNNFYKVSANVPLDSFIALGCALPTMLKGLENMRPIERGSAVLVQGCGAVGLAAIFLAKIAGASGVQLWMMRRNFGRESMGRRGSVGSYGKGD